jgi:AraC-like ligand binding domain
MTPSVADAAGSGLEGSCGPDEWVDATGPVHGVELFRARLRGRPFSRHRHDVYAIGVTEEGVQEFEYRGTVERSLPGQVFVLHPDELHDGRTDGPGLFGYRQIYVHPDRIVSALPALTGRPAPLPFAPPVTDDPAIARVVRVAFTALAARRAAPSRNGGRGRLRRPGPLHPRVQSGVRHDARPLRETLHGLRR